MGLSRLVPDAKVDKSRLVALMIRLTRFRGGGKMNTRGLLDQLLKSGRDLLQNKAGGAQNKSSSGGLGCLLGGS